jgi:hypothetical protein
MYQIDKNIPFPPPSNSLHQTIRNMQVGDSTIIPKYTRNKIYTYAKLNGFKMRTRTTEEGIRMWRVE